MLFRLVVVEFYSWRYTCRSDGLGTHLSDCFNDMLYMLGVIVSECILSEQTMLNMVVMRL